MALAEGQIENATGLINVNEIAFASPRIEAIDAVEDRYGWEVLEARAGEVVVGAYPAHAGVGMEPRDDRVVDH